MKSSHEVCWHYKADNMFGPAHFLTLSCLPPWNPTVFSIAYTRKQPTSTCGKKFCAVSLKNSRILRYDKIARSIQVGLLYMIRFSTSCTWDLWFERRQNFRFKTKEKIGVTFWHWDYGRWIQHGSKTLNSPEFRPPLGSEDLLTNCLCSCDNHYKNKKQQLYMYMRNGYWGINVIAKRGRNQLFPDVLFGYDISSFLAICRSLPLIVFVYVMYGRGFVHFINKSYSVSSYVSASLYCTIID